MFPPWSQPVICDEKCFLFVLLKSTMPTDFEWASYMLCNVSEKVSKLSKFAFCIPLSFSYNQNKFR